MIIGTPKPNISGVLTKPHDRPGGNVEVQWKCKTPHADCGALRWQSYMKMTESAAADFMEQKAPNSLHFKYRIKP